MVVDNAVLRLGVVVHPILGDVDHRPAVLLRNPANDTAEVYVRTITERYLHEKRQVAKELERRGIASILTRPQDLSVNVINKYVEIKSRGLL